MSLNRKDKYAGVNAAVTFRDMDVMAERPWMGLQRVTEVLTLSSPDRR
ncbi:hypothetical protein [Shewanella sp. UCD-KL12]|nr:hypothetical protein [Shewanella sp. UCD-KL12]